MKADSSKGDKLMEDAAAALNKWRPFGNKYEDAAELYKNAGNAFKLSKNFQKAGDAFRKEAEMYVMTKSKHDAASSYQQAATCYQKTSISDAVDCLSKATEYYIDAGRFQIAAKQEQQMGEMLEESGDIEQALSHYQTAADYFEGEGQNSAAAKVKLKVADHSAMAEKYAIAIQIYEETGVSYLANNLLKWSAKDLFTKAGICHLCSDDLVSAKRALERYQDLDVTFANQRECKFLLKLIESCEGYDSDGLTVAIREYNSITPLDNWKTTLLLRVKNLISTDAQNEDMT